MGEFARKFPVFRMRRALHLTDWLHLLHFEPVPMIFLIGIAAAAAGAVLAFWLARASAQRQLAEQRAALAAELAAAKRDNEWLTGQIDP